MLKCSSLYGSGCQQRFRSRLEDTHIDDVNRGKSFKRSNDGGLGIFKRLLHEYNLLFAGRQIPIPRMYISSTPTYFQSGADVLECEPVWTDFVPSVKCQSIIDAVLVKPEFQPAKPLAK